MDFSFNVTRMFIALCVVSTLVKVSSIKIEIEDLKQGFNSHCASLNQHPNMKVKP